MSKAEAIKQFIKKRIAEIDSSLLPDDDLLSKLKSSSMRTSFANVVNVLLRFSMSISTKKKSLE
jgi:hypothetical protein